MYARATLALINIDKIEQFRKIYEESVVPAAKKQKGCPYPIGITKKMHLPTRRAAIIRNR
jgi:hypothetical protein